MIKEQKSQQLKRKYERKGATLVFKPDGNYPTWWLRVLVAILSFISSKIIHDYAQTIGTYVLVPWSQKDHDWRAYGHYTTLRHEMQHIEDYQNHPVWFVLSYLFLLPVFFTMRSHWEFRGYTQNMLTEHEEFGHITDETIQRIADQFVGPSYFWMHYSRKKVVEKLNSIRDKIEE